jgi:hypothetical protein
MEEHVRSEVSANREADVENAQGNISPATIEGRMDGPTRDDAEQVARIGDPIDGEFQIEAAAGNIDNAASDPESDPRRSGGSPNDPDGGHELLGREWRGPNPDPISEMVPGGQGAEPPPYGSMKIAEDMAGVARRQLKAGPSDTDPPTLRGGNPNLGANPSDLAPSLDPTSEASRQREGMYESGGQNSGQPTDEDASRRRETAEQHTASLAFTGSQTPNLPPVDQRDPDLPDHVPGSGRLEEPVERRQNSLVFNPDTGNFEVKQEMHETGVSSQKGDTRA